MQLNDIKTRADHERHAMPKNFWHDVAEAMNGADDDDSTAVLVVLPVEDGHYEEVAELDLLEFDIMTSDAIKKKVMLLLKIRKAIQENMTLSGEHDSDAFNFVEVAMRKVGKSGLTLLRCYYFFKLCDQNPEVDVRYSIQMDIVLRGNTDDDLSSFDKNSEAGVNQALKNEKKRAYAAITDMSDVAKTIAEAMNETNRLAKESAKSAQDSAAALIKQNRLAKQAQLIGLAQHLGKNDLLEQILASFSSASD